MASLEQRYIEQMKSLGTYDPAFDDSIKMLATLEREHRRTRKAWDATTPKGEPADPLNELYDVILKQRRDINALRETLGLTPKGLQRLRGKNSKESTQNSAAGISAKLDEMLLKVMNYDSPTL